MKVISMARLIISWIRSGGCMEAPSWRHRCTNNGYHKSVATVVVAAVDEDVVAGCMASVTVPEAVDKTKEGEAATDEFR